MSWTLVAARGRAVCAHTLIATVLRRKAEHMQVAPSQQPLATSISPTSQHQDTPQH